MRVLASKIAVFLVGILCFSGAENPAGAVTISPMNLEFGIVDIGTTKTLSLSYLVQFAYGESFISSSDPVGNALFSFGSRTDSAIGSDRIINYQVGFTPTDPGIFSKLFQITLTYNTLVKDDCGDLNPFSFCFTDVLGTKTSSTSFVRGTGQEAVSTIPLPPAAYLFGTALLGLAVIRRRKHKNLAQA